MSFLHLVRFTHMQKKWAKFFAKFSWFRSWSCWKQRERCRNFVSRCAHACILISDASPALAVLKWATFAEKMKPSDGTRARISKYSATRSRSALIISSSSSAYNLTFTHQKQDMKQDLPKSRWRRGANACRELCRDAMSSCIPENSEEPLTDARRSSEKRCARPAHSSPLHRKVPCEGPMRSPSSAPTKDHGFKT